MWDAFLNSINYSEVGDMKITLSKSQWHEIGQKSGWLKTAGKFLVVDNEFNRTNYPDMVGKFVDSPVSYAQVVPMSNLKNWVQEAVDLIDQPIKLLMISNLTDEATELRKMQEKILSKISK